MNLAELLAGLFERQSDGVTCLSSARATCTLANILKPSLSAEITPHDTRFRCRFVSWSLETMSENVERLNKFKNKGKDANVSTSLRHGGFVWRQLHLKKKGS